MTTRDDRAGCVSGYVAPGFETVREAFEANFVDRGEIGAAFAATLDGRTVIDLWGGLADSESGRVWTQDTLAVIFSGTKGLVGLCLLMLHDRGELDIFRPVCEYWPEFEANGKGDVRVIDLASHCARLPGLREPITEDDVIDDVRLASLLAAQAQESDPRAGDAYHPLTFGWLCGEVVRRADGRSVGQFFAEEVARPLGLEIWVGLPAGLESRVARLEYAKNWGGGAIWDPAMVAKDELVQRVWHNPPVLAPGHMPWNRSDWHQAEIPGAGGIGTARSLARLYGCLAAGGEFDGRRLLSEDALRLGRTEVTRRVDPLVDEPLAFGVGFELQTDLYALGGPDDAFGHGGAGGSVHCAWPSHGVGLSYVMNLLRDDHPVDTRGQALLSALHVAVSRARRGPGETTPESSASA